MRSKAKKKGLGTGLGVLLGERDVQLEESHEKVYSIDINDISPAAGQPRSYFDEERLEELAQSIRENGVIQPILLSQRGPRSYELVAGERRWRAARLAGLREIPAIVRALDKERALKQSVIENIQREDLNPIEEAKAFAHLIESLGLTQEGLSEILGKSRSAIANTLRLNRLAPEIQDLVIRQELSEGHARTLLALPEIEAQLRMADRIIEGQWSVRETERQIRLAFEKKPKPVNEKQKDAQSVSNLKALEEALSKLVGSKVQVKDKNGRGSIVIKYKDLHALDEILLTLGIKEETR